MFTGIIKSLGIITDIKTIDDNKTFTVSSELSSSFSIDQSVSHNGICLTVVELGDDYHKVTAIHETLDITTAKDWEVGDKLNLETAAKLHANLDGHIVQGHIDGIAKILDIEDEHGSFRVSFEFPEKFAPYVISKGSICIDGVSLTVIEPTRDTFSVAIIPYTWKNTIFHTYKKGSEVNLEFDIVGKYILRYQMLK